MLELAYSRYRAGAAGLAYNEAAFRHFLAIERRRVTRGHRWLVLVLVSVQARRGVSAVLTPTIAGALFRGLGHSVREVDFVGWYREQRIAGAVLVQPADVSPEVPRVIDSRIRVALEDELTPDLWSALRIRIVPLAGTWRRLP